MNNFILLSTQQQQISEDSGKILFNTQLSGLFFLSEKKNKKNSNSWLKIPIPLETLNFQIQVINYSYPVYSNMYEHNSAPVTHFFLPACTYQILQITINACHLFTNFFVKSFETHLCILTMWFVEFW